VEFLTTGSTAVAILRLSIERFYPRATVSITYNSPMEGMMTNATHPTFATRNDLPTELHDTMITVLNPTSADLFTEISRTIDKHLWMLEAHLQA
jgi:hypothetical protein